jgi:hypothetical protein
MAYLAGADLSRASLSAVKLSGAALSQAHLYETSFINMNLVDVVGLEACTLLDRAFWTTVLSPSPARFGFHFFAVAASLTNSLTTFPHCCCPMRLTAVKDSRLTEQSLRLSMTAVAKAGSGS